MTSRIPILDKKAIEKMKRSGEIAAELKGWLRKWAVPGVTTRELDERGEEFILRESAKPAFKNYRGYPASIITCLNEELVHAIPGDRQLREGDLLTVDLGAVWQGYYSDTAVTFPIGKTGMGADLFLNVGKVALMKAINQCIEGRHVGDISFAIQSVVEGAGYHVVRMYTGHGVGRELHQPPEIPCFGEKGSGEVLRAGMGLAVEVMYVQGESGLRILEDGWTAVTADGQLSAHFEETVIVGKESPLILTAKTGS
ncbi:type I methionyl aminopeptidase [candidate division CPR3 bacterium 4484_211]|uniref:Methionine aminopeptidase n=1 Tax=candidate division CPR3 bacterium 4484_211 TaxID=1968527 RepID=A0A1W9NZP9_UNCC3|nr:MAG: type I methionyl aminopeptidase [candidate division CPR3 bacterium 4484_211]